MTKPVVNTEGLQFRPDSPLREPKLGAHIATICCKVTTIELLLASMLAGFMASEAGVGLSIYNSIENEGSRLAILRTMAARALNPEGLKELNRILEKIRKRRPERNNVVHGLWGTSPHYKDALIWADPRDMISHLGDIAVATFTKKPSPKPSHRKALVYVEEDFIEIQKRLDALLKEVGTLLRNMPDYVGR
jgi:hypothetical protein